MTKEQIIKAAADHALQSPGNCMNTEEAIRYGIEGLRLFDAPEVAFGDAEDPLFEKLKEKGVVGPHFLAPNEWLPEAKTVISIFLPFSREVRSSNRSNDGVPSTAWLFGRVEGQEFVNEMAAHMAAFLREQGYQALVPGLDSRFRSVTAPDASLGKSWEGVAFSSNWSERHVAFVCGLGTFGLSKGLITQKGMAGRFCSVVTDAVIPPTERAYKDVYEYCIRCGACAARCPAEAITLDQGKDHRKCAPFVGKTKVLYAPRYGCGKCQVRVPCESAIPRK